MKKLLALILAGMMVFSLAACGGDDKNDGKGDGAETASFEELKAEYQSKTPEDLISENIKDKTKPSAEEIAALVKTGIYGEMSEKNIFEHNITDEALRLLTDEDIDDAYATSFYKDLIDSDDKLVKAFVYDCFADFIPLDDKELEDDLIEHVKSETDNIVIACALNGLKNALSERSEFVDYAIECTQNEDPVIRYWAAMAIGFYRMEDNDKCVDALIPLMNDSDTEVAKMACKEIGGFGNEKAVEPLSAVLADEAKVDLHGSATDSLEDLWMGYPSYEGTSEAAYRAYMAYLNTDSEYPDIPAWISVASMTNPGGKYEEWKTNSTYFNVTEVIATLTKIVGDAGVDGLTRSTAIQRIGAFGTVADLEALKAVVAGDESLISDIDSAIAEKN